MQRRKCAPDVALQQRRGHGGERHNGSAGQVYIMLLMLVWRCAAQRNKRHAAQAVLGCTLHANMHCRGGGGSIGRGGGIGVKHGLQRRRRGCKRRLVAKCRERKRGSEGGGYSSALERVVDRSSVRVHPQHPQCVAAGGTLQQSFEGG